MPRSRKLYVSEFISRYCDEFEERFINIYLRNGTLLVHFKSFYECHCKLIDTPYWNYQVYKWDIGINVNIYL